MRTFHPRLRSLAWLLTLASALTACGGGKDPILGTSQGTALAPSVSATAPLARNPAITGVAINTQVTATFSKAMWNWDIGNIYSHHCFAKTT